MERKGGVLLVAGFCSTTGAVCPPDRPGQASQLAVKMLAGQTARWWAFLCMCPRLHAYHASARPPHETLCKEVSGDENVVGLVWAGRSSKRGMAGEVVDTLRGKLGSPRGNSIVADLNPSAQCDVMCNVHTTPPH